VSKSLHTVRDDPSRDAGQPPVWPTFDERGFRIDEKAVLSSEIAAHASPARDEATSGLRTLAEAVENLQLHALRLEFPPEPSPTRFGATAKVFQRPSPEPSKSRFRHLCDADKPNRATTIHRIPVTAWTR
jgi:hypothetical protein